MNPITTSSPNFVIPSPEAKAAIAYLDAADIISDRTYFKQSEVAPHIRSEDGKLIIHEGRGKRRSWGTPSCRTELTWLQLDLLQVHLRWSNKHYWGRANFYFRFSPVTGWKRRFASHSEIKVLRL